jgi:TM2 domain-containing membrane protein YozV/RNA polymerase subunit RPABC4/transcription elongation factor Spt4
VICFACPRCQKSLEAQNEHAGKPVACPTCGESFYIPGERNAGPTAGANPATSSCSASTPDSSDVLDVLHADANAPSPDAKPVAGKAKDQKYCIECGALIRARAAICPDCGVSQTEDQERSEKHCPECGYVMRGTTAVCPKCGIEQPGLTNTTDAGAGSNRVAAGVCAILVGALGIHKFILGYNTAGITMLLVSILAFCFYGWAVMHIIALVEGITYLSMTEKDFQRIHGKRTRPWF